VFEGASAPSRSHGRTRIVVRAGCIVALAIAGLSAEAALAVGPGLPRTYDVVRHGSPFPGAVGQYPLGLSNAGDLDGDGKEDFITAQLVNTRNDAGAISAAGNGAIYIISGATNERIRTIESPDPGGTGNAANFAFPWVSKVGANRRAPAAFTDLGSCANRPPNAGEECQSPTVGGPDGVPDILVGARGVDAKTRRDSGRVYVFDGATFALLKRIDQPASDTTDLALSRTGGSWFGRTVLNPAGLPPCEGNAGVGTCETVSQAVAAGDVDGGGLADLIVGASSTSENWMTAAPGSHCARTTGAICQAAGRVYVYRGENIVGSSPREILDGTVAAGGTAENVTTIRNPHAQANNQNPTNGDSQIFGNSLTPIGDVGSCKATATVPVPAPGGLCPRDNGSTSPDGKPDYVISGQRNDLPLDDPDPALADAGAAYLVDGATSTILIVYRHPEAQLGATFGSSEVPFAAGDLGDTGLPDVFIPASGQNVPGFTGAGRGYVLNGNHKASVNAVNFARLDDPTPSTAGGFGPGATGVGDLVPGAGSPANELLVGSASSRSSRNDVHFFNAATERVLQTILDPDAQADGRSASQFGEQIIPLGDLNDDTYLDFGVTAPLYDSPTFTDEGRVYIFRSNNTPLPPVAPPPPPPAAAAETPPPAAATTPAAAAAAAATGGAELLAGRCANDLRGTNDKDSLIGTTAGDTVFGLNGDDVVDSLSGDDCVDAGGDDDNIVGGSGNDSLLGGSGRDKLDGDSGGDRLFGQTAVDILTGGAGRDMLAGGDADDRLSGGSDRDRLFGERGKDVLFGGSGSDTLDGGSGSDRIYSLDRSRDTVRCGTGFDRAVVDRLDRVSGCERVTRRRA